MPAAGSDVPSRPFNREPHRRCVVSQARDARPTIKTVALAHARGMHNAQASKPRWQCLWGRTWNVNSIISTCCKERTHLGACPCVRAFHLLDIFMLSVNSSAGRHNAASLQRRPAHVTHITTATAAAAAAAAVGVRRFRKFTRMKRFAETVKNVNVCVCVRQSALARCANRFSVRGRPKRHANRIKR